MKKHNLLFFVAIMVVCLIVALVGCDDQKDKSGEISLTSDMSLKELRSALINVDSFSIELQEAGESEKRVMKITQNGRAINSADEYNVQFIEDGIEYVFEKEDGKCSYTKTNLNGYDLANTENNNVLDYLYYYVISTLESDNFTIKDGEVAITVEDVATIRLFDMNKTIISPPDEYKDNYKNLEENKPVVVFEDVADSATECKISKFNVRLTSYTVPEQYKGKNVVELCDFQYYVGNIIIPTTIKTICGRGYDYSDFTANYLGTKEQWHAIAFPDSIAGTEPYDVHCTDGDLKCGDNWSVAET